MIKFSGELSLIWMYSWAENLAVSRQIRIGSIGRLYAFASVITSRWLSLLPEMLRYCKHGRGLSKKASSGNRQMPLIWILRLFSCLRSGRYYSRADVKVSSPDALMLSRERYRRDFKDAKHLKALSDSLNVERAILLIIREDYKASIILSISCWQLSYLRILISSREWIEARII